MDPEQKAAFESRSIYRPSELHQFLQELGVSAKKSLSQNFLIDGNILEKMALLADVSGNDLVIEIGPGPGALTERLLQKGAHVIAIEKDRCFAAALHRLQTSDNRLQIFEADFLNFSFTNLIPEGKKAKVVANLPYHLTAPILARLAPLHTQIHSLTLMVQKEVADRFIAQKNGKNYSSISVFLQYWSTPRYCFAIEPTCFFPRPKVRSAVVQLFLKPPPGGLVASEFFSIVRAAFQKRRKMLRSSLKPFYRAETVEQNLEKLSLNPESRPENLSLDEWARFVSLLSSSVERSNNSTTD